jgi:hypothetical protein
MRRIYGLLLIVRAFAPLLMVLTIYWGYTRMIDSIQAALSPVESIRIEIAELGETFETARTQFDTARTHAEAAIATIQGFRVPNLLPNLSNLITIPGISIPDLNVPIVPTITVNFSDTTGSISRTIEGACRTVFDFFGIGDLVCDPARTVTESINIRYPSGLTFSTTNYRIVFPDIPSFTIPTPPLLNTIASGLEGVFSEFDTIFGMFDQTLARINALGQAVSTLPENFNTIAQSSQQLIDNLRSVIAERAVIVGIAFVVVLILLVIRASAGFVEQVQRGLRLLFGG